MADMKKTLVQSTKLLNWKLFSEQKPGKEGSYLVFDGDDWFEAEWLGDSWTGECGNDPLVIFWAEVPLPG